MVTYALPGIFVMGCLLCLMESYVIRCPEQSEWNIRAGIQCKNITDYFCLYNYIYYAIEEGCTGPEWDIPGRKRVYSKNFNTAPCRDTRYQPIIFVTNGNSDCIFRKSLCTEEGQTLFTNGTTRTDSTCRCDYTQGYAYATVPRNKYYCRPSEEDCSCYLKKCKGVGYNLSADYECTNDITKKADYPLISANAYEDQHIYIAPTGTLREDDSYVIRRKCDVFFVVLFCIFGMIVITTCFMLFETLLRCPHQSTEEADNAESKRMDTGPSLDTIEQNASNDESVFTICVIFHQRLARCLQQFTKKAWKDGIGRIETDPSLNTTYQNATSHQSAVEVHIESGMIDAGPSLNTTEQNATNDQSAVEVHIESGRMDAGPLLKIIDHNATNDQSADNAESKRMDTGPSLYTIEQNASNDESVLAGKAGSEMTNTCPSLDTNEQNASNNESAGTAESERIDTGPSLNTLEQNPSNDESDDEDQIGLGKLDENRISAVDELKGCIEKEGLHAAFTHFNVAIDNWRNEPVKLALTGKSGVGKSSFINSIRNLKAGDPGSATTSSSGNTTQQATVYKFPGNKMITLHDLPGFGTTHFPKNEYEEKMGLRNYDYVLIFVGNIEENDIGIARKLKEMDKPFCFVRSKIDIDIENAKNDGEPETEVMEKIMLKSLDILKHARIEEARFFVISNQSRRIGHFNELVSYIRQNLPKLKCDAVMFSLLGELTDDIIDSKYKLLKERIWKVSVASAGLAATPVPGLDVVLNLGLICREILLYHTTFGFGQKIVKEILKDEYLRKELSASSITEIMAASKAMQTFVILQLRKLGTSMAVESALDWIFPFIGSIVSGATAFAVTRQLLTRILDGCRDDAKLVYYHFMIVNARK